MSGGRPGRSVEFKLKSTSSSRALHNIMILGGHSVNMESFTTPVRMIRDPSASPLGVASSTSTTPGGVDYPSNGAPSVGYWRKKKSKSRLLFPGSENDSDGAADEQDGQGGADSKELTSEVGHEIPWLLEDFDGQHSYVGNLIDPASNYVIFINQGNEFRVVLVNRWYRFIPKPSYVPLTLEEAERQMASKGRHEEFDRWLMKKRSEATVEGEEGPSKSAGSADNMRDHLSLQSRVKAKVSTRLVRTEEESFDYVEHFDDDEGLLDDDENANVIGTTATGGASMNDGIMQEEGEFEVDPTMPSMFSGGKRLTDAGREIQRIMKSLDKVGNEGHPMWKRGEGFTPSGDATTYTSSVSPIISSSTMAATTVTASVPPNLTANTHATASSNQLSEIDVVTILRQSGPLHIRDLISRLRDKLRVDPRNKDLLREIVRRVATVRSNSLAGVGDEKLLELKPEFMS